MYARLVAFDGPRTAAQVEASATAGRERITPLLDADPIVRDGLVAGYRCVAEDGAEIVFAVAESMAVLDRITAVATTSELLPGEDPALLSGPDRVEVYGVTDVFGRVQEARR